MAFLETEMARALGDDEFFPVFQPIVELRTEQLAGFEVLARWKHGRLGLVMPADFIPAVEKSGLMDEMTVSLLEKAFRLPVLTGTAYRLNVNLSAVQLRRSDLPKRIARIAAEAKFSLDRLTIEITESALVSDLTSALKVAVEFKALQCRLALDDFGTGYSSLQHLHSLPFDELKVDRSFVSSMMEKRESRKIVAAVLGLGNSLELTTVAEGVETLEQANMLHVLECDLGQGWRYGKPMPAAEVPRLISELQARATTGGTKPPEEGSVLSLEALPVQRLAQLQAIFDGAPVGLCFLDRKLRYVNLNKRLAQLNGQPASAHIGKTVSEVIPNFYPRIEPYLRRALQGEPITGLEIQRVLPDGNEVSEVLSYQPARDEAGEVVGISVAVMDVTEANLTKRALLEAEDHYRHMVELSPHVPWVLDSHGHVAEASFTRWQEFTGQPFAEAVGDGWLRMLHPDDVEPSRQAIQHTLQTGDSIDIRYRIRHPGDDWVWMRSRGSPRFNSAGEIVCIYGVVEPDAGVERSDELRQELQRCHVRLQAAVDAVPIGIVLADARDGTVVIVNPKAYEIFQGKVFPGQNLMEYSRIKLLHLDGSKLSPNDFPLVRAIQRGEQTESKDILFERPDGSRAHLSFTSRPIEAEDDKRIGALSMVQEL